MFWSLLKHTKASAKGNAKIFKTVESKTHHGESERESEYARDSTFGAGFRVGKYSRRSHMHI